MINVLTTAQVQKDDYYNEHMMGTYTAYIGKEEGADAKVWESNFNMEGSETEINLNAAKALYELAEKLVEVAAQQADEAVPA